VGNKKDLEEEREVTFLEASRQVTPRKGLLLNRFQKSYFQIGLPKKMI